MCRTHVTVVVVVDDRAAGRVLMRWEHKRPNGSVLGVEMASSQFEGGLWGVKPRPGAHEASALTT